MTVSPAVSLLFVAACSVALAGCSEAPAAVDAPARPNAVRASDSGTVPGRFASLRFSLDTASDHHAPLVETARNPFRFDPGDPAARGTRRLSVTKAAPPASPRPGQVFPRAVTSAARTAAGRSGALRFIGLVEARARGRRVAVLADGDGVYHGEVNDILVGRYQVVAITDASVEIEDLSRGARTVLQVGTSASGVDE